MFSPNTAAHNNSSGRQNLAFGNGDMNCVSDNGHQVNNYNQHTTFTMPPDLLWPMVQVLIDPKSKDKEPYHAMLAKWLTQQSDQTSPGPRYHHLDILEKPTPGTGTWVLSTPEFERWRDGSSSYRFLFMLGILGSGKSMLISIIIDFLKKKYRERKDIICIDLLFHKGEDKAPLVPNIWASLLLQLLQNQGPGGIANELMSEFDKCLRGTYDLHPSRYLELFKAQAKTFIKGITDALNQLPRNLNKAYEHAVRQISKKDADDRRLANHALTWIVHAKTDLIAEQIEDSFAFRENKGGPWEHYRPRRGSSVSVCAGLVVEDTTKGTLRLVHESVRHYLEGTDMIYANADLDMAKTCILCLLADKSPDKPETPLLTYAANHWTQHCSDDKHLDSNTKTQLQEFFNNESKLERAFGAITDTPSQPVNGMTGLHAAVFYNLTARARKLIKAGVQVNAQCSDGQTALHWAVSLGRLKFVKYLIHKGAKPNLRDRLGKAGGDTPIHKCLSSPTLSNLDIVRSLVDGNASLVVKGARGLTPLSMAIRYGPTSVAELFINSQKDVNTELEYGWTSLRELLYYGHQMVNSVDKSAKKNRNTSKEGWKSLKRAIDDHGQYLMRLLFRRGVDLNRPTKDNWLPLIHAVKNGQAKHVQSFLNKQPDPANVNIRDPNNGWSPLRWAFFYKSDRIVRQLIEADSDLKADLEGWTPLIEAVQNGDHDLVWLLLNKGAHPDTLDSKGWSALHYAIKSKNKDIAWLLVTKKASMETHAEGVPDFLELALSVNDLSTALLLHEHGANLHATDSSGMTALHRACNKGILAHVRFLLNLGAKISVKDAENFTPLHQSVLRDSEEVVNLLASRAQHPEDLDEQDGMGQTALLLATQLKKWTILNSLLRHGASCDVQDREGLTALHRAADQGFNDGLRLLVSQTGNVNLADNRGYTALHHAVKSEVASAETDDAFHSLISGQKLQISHDSFHQGFDLFRLWDRLQCPEVSLSSGSPSGDDDELKNVEKHCNPIGALFQHGA
ncbi:hypothetical protein CEP54_012310 [Fusarium duplospermum]|uniref:Nephrocystin 3-like N-terminal domain-containing protein n=1 Tax=Fusarium duplospermum TaxID=1325734 RepID=A0A428P9L7_9HYPO|nr:hypothetical protein CEP54_012310 [Fusarium duplospermum]